MVRNDIKNSKNKEQPSLRVKILFAIGWVALVIGVPNLIDYCMMRDSATVKAIVMSKGQFRRIGARHGHYYAEIYVRYILDGVERTTSVSIPERRKDIYRDLEVNDTLIINVSRKNPFFRDWDYQYMKCKKE